MLLAIDYGNTNAVFAVCDLQKPVSIWRISTNPSRTADEYAALLEPLMTKAGFAFDDISKVLISSVVPHANYELKCFSLQHLGYHAFFIGENRSILPMKVETDTPAEVGADRLINALAAYQRYGNNAAIIVDFGTATTFDYINEHGNYQGGVIAPGVNLSMDALHQAAAKLPEIAICKPIHTIGKNTITAMQSGVYYGYIGLVKEILLQMQSNLPSPAVTIATGGLAKLYAEPAGIDHLDSDLTLYGLIAMYHTQQNGK